MLSAATPFQRTVLDSLLFQNAPSPPSNDIGPSPAQHTPTPSALSDAAKRSLSELRTILTDPCHPRIPYPLESSHSDASIPTRSATGAAPDESTETIPTRGLGGTVTETISRPHHNREYIHHARHMSNGADDHGHSRDVMQVNRSQQPHTHQNYENENHNSAHGPSHSHGGQPTPSMGLPMQTRADSAPLAVNRYNNLQSPDIQAAFVPHPSSSTAGGGGGIHMGAYCPQFQHTTSFGYIDASSTTQTNGQSGGMNRTHGMDGMNYSNRGHPHAPTHLTHFQRANPVYNAYHHIHEKIFHNRYFDQHSPHQHHHQSYQSGVSFDSPTLEMKPIENLPPPMGENFVGYSAYYDKPAPQSSNMYIDYSNNNGNSYNHSSHNIATTATTEKRANEEDCDLAVRIYKALHLHPLPSQYDCEKIYDIIDRIDELVHFLIAIVNMPLMELGSLDGCRRVDNKELHHAFQQWLDRKSDEQSELDFMDSPPDSDDEEDMLGLMQLDDLFSRVTHQQSAYHNCFFLGDLEENEKIIYEKNVMLINGVMANCAGMQWFSTPDSCYLTWQDFARAVKVQRGSNVLHAYGPLLKLDVSCNRVDLSSDPWSIGASTPHVKDYASYYFNRWKKAKNILEENNKRSSDPKEPEQVNGRYSMCVRTREVIDKKKCIWMVTTYTVDITTRGIVLLCQLEERQMNNQITILDKLFGYSVIRTYNQIDVSERVNGLNNTHLEDSNPVLVTQLRKTMEYLLDQRNLRQDMRKFRELIHVPSAVNLNNIATDPHSDNNGSDNDRMSLEDFCNIHVLSAFMRVYHSRDVQRPCTVQLLGFGLCVFGTPDTTPSLNQPNKPLVLLKGGFSIPVLYASGWKKSSAPGVFWVTWFKDRVFVDSYGMLFWNINYMKKLEPLSSPITPVLCCSCYKTQDIHNVLQSALHRKFDMNCWVPVKLLRLLVSAALRNVTSECKCLKQTVQTHGSIDRFLVEY